jgi:hypothetical protein
LALEEALLEPGLVAHYAALCHFLLLGLFWRDLVALWRFGRVLEGVRVGGREGELDRADLRVELMVDAATSAELLLGRLWRG